jgi:hypothetical protein
LSPFIIVIIVPNGLGNIFLKGILFSLINIIIYLRIKNNKTGKDLLFIDEAKIIS